MRGTIGSHVAHETVVLCGGFVGVPGSGSRGNYAVSKRDAGIRCRPNAEFGGAATVVGAAIELGQLRTVTQSP